MIDFFTIFTKGGLVLWCFDTTGAFVASVNQLIHDGILQGKATGRVWRTQEENIQFVMDNEFDLLFVVAYQKILQLGYVDKLLNEIQMRFRDRYKNELADGNFSQAFQFTDEFDQVYRKCLRQAEKPALKQPRRWQDTEKAAKNAATLVKNNDTRSGTEAKPSLKKAKQNGERKPVSVEASSFDSSEKTVEVESAKKSVNHGNEKEVESNVNNPFVVKIPSGKAPRQFVKKQKTKAAPTSKLPTSSKKSKTATVWNETVDPELLDYSKKNGSTIAEKDTKGHGDKPNEETYHRQLFAEKFVGTAVGEIKEIEYQEEDDEEEENDVQYSKKLAKSSGFLGSLTTMFSGKVVDVESLTPFLAAMKDHLMNKNVATDVAEMLCQIVAKNLDGKTISGFQTMSSLVKQAMTDAVVSILTPKRPIGVLTDALKAKAEGRPFVIVFCGVNGVGKSTNLTKIAFWLIENSLSVLIAACDTFRSGAVEQLQTHVNHLDHLHPAAKHHGKQMVTLYQRGYGGDAANVCFNAIAQATANKTNVVLVDTAGRMQDNEPLMRALSKLIHMNNPDMVLFVGEALVGNEAVDQVKRFNQCLLDFAPPNSEPRLIDGIVLTKFDTVDDKVGAAVSMVYTTGQPIVFVGTGQTYPDLRKLNAGAVVTSLLK